MDNRHLAGVFEGGGAKGVAYAGALRAVADAGLWFGAVAGSSAGAITAALIGAGYDADAIGQMSDGAMACLQSELSPPCHSVGTREVHPCSGVISG